MSDLKNHCWKHESWSKDCFDCHQFHKIAKQAAEIERLQKQLEGRSAVCARLTVELEACRESNERDRKAWLQCMYDLQCSRDQAERYRKALNWIVNNASSWGLEAEGYVARAREALDKPKEAE